MENLPEKLYDSICRKLDEGDGLMSDGKTNEALTTYKEALNLLPEPRDEWDIFTTIAVSIADCYYEKQQYAEADSYYAEALKSGDGVSNPYVWYARGRNYVKLGDITAAKDALMRAYMLDGDDVFEIDDDEFKAYITEEID